MDRLRGPFHRDIPAGSDLGYYLKGREVDLKGGTNRFCNHWSYFRYDTGDLCFPRCYWSSDPEKVVHRQPWTFVSARSVRNSRIAHNEPKKEPFERFRISQESFGGIGVRRWPGIGSLPR